MPKREAAALAKRQFYHHLLFQLEWLALAERPVAGLLKDARRIRSPNNEAFRWSGEQKGVVLATVHMGPYPLTLAWVLHRHFQGRDIIVVKASASDADEDRALARLAAFGVSITLLRPGDPGQFHELLKKVRRGAVLLSLVDLPSAYGRPTPIDLLSVPAFFGSGVVDVAGLCDVPIILFRTRTRTGNDDVIVDDIISVDRTSDQRERATSRLRSFINAAILDEPAQWHMWPRFGEYLAIDRIAS